MGSPSLKPETTLLIDGGFLRPLCTDDVHPTYIQGLNNPEVNRFLDGVRQTLQTVDTVKDFVSLNETSDDSVLFGIWQNGAEHHCGTVRLHGINSHHRTAHIGICIFDKSAWRKKLGSKAISAVTRWAFDELTLRWVEAGIYEENVSSIHAFENAGYVLEFDIAGKYLLEGTPKTIKILVAKSAT